MPPEKKKETPKHLGEIALQHGWITPAQLEECLQEVRRASGEPPRLGQILVRKGYLTRDQVRQVMKEQAKEIFLCPTCANRYNVAFWKEGKTVCCPSCRSTMIRLTQMTGLVVDGTIECE